MDKYSLIKRINNDFQFQFYMYTFMYDRTETIAEKGYFQSTKTFI